MHITDFGTFQLESVIQNDVSPLCHFYGKDEKVIVNDGGSQKTLLFDGTGKNVRNFEVADNQLVLTPVDASEGWRVTYDRQ